MNLFDIPGASEALTGLLTGAATLVLSKRKQNADVKSSELDNVEKAVEIWRKLAEDLTKKVAELTSEVTEQRQEISRLETKVDELSHELAKHNN